MPFPAVIAAAGLAARVAAPTIAKTVAKQGAIRAVTGALGGAPQQNQNLQPQQFPVYQHPDGIV